MTKVPHDVTRSSAEDGAEVTRLIGKLPGGFMLVFLAAGFMLTLINPATFQTPRGADILSGEWAAQYQASYEEQLHIRQGAIEAWGVLNYVLFEDGRYGVLIGSGGWLFTAEEFENSPFSQAILEANLDYLRDIHAQLESQDIELIVALVPAKARVYTEKLGGYAIPHRLEDRYSDALGRIRELGIPAPDLYERLMQGKESAPVFLRTDTHWTPFGATVAAQAVAEVAPQSGEEAFETRIVEEDVHHGDLINFVPLGVLQERLGPKPDRLEVTQTVQIEGASGGLFDEVDIPVTLVGTSYSAHSAWNFDGALKSALAADVLNVAVEGQGPFEPMSAYLAGARFAETPPQLVIWEIPERYLTTTPAPSGAAARER